MKKQVRKRMAILTIVSTMIVGGLFAQPGHSPRQGQPPQQPPIPDGPQIAQMVDELTQTLSLTDEQTVIILGLYTNHFAEVKSKMEADKIQHEKQQSKMDNFKKQFEEEVKALLTDEQKEQFDEFLQSQRPQESERPQRGSRR